MMVAWEHGGGDGGGDVVFRVSVALEEARRMVGDVVLGQKSETFFFRSFLFQTERRPKSSADIPNTLRNSAWERCLCRGERERQRGQRSEVRVERSRIFPALCEGSSFTSNWVLSTPGGSLLRPLWVTTSIS